MGALSYQKLLLPLRPVEVERHIETSLERRVAIEVTANRSTMVRVLPELGRVRVRINSMFLYAPPLVLDALAAYVRRPRDPGANVVLDAFIRGESHRLPPPPERTLAPRGARHDLQEIFDRLNRELFCGRVGARIGWGRGDRQRRRASILFGSYLKPPGAELGTIRIHPALDEAWVPLGFVELVVFHEMLHDVIPTRCEEGKRAYHPPEFRRRERQFPGYREWRRWERDNLPRFLAGGQDPAPEAPGRGA